MAEKRARSSAQRRPPDGSSEQGGTVPLDDTDLAILRVLQANARATFTEIGKAVGLSAPSAHDRVHRLERRGVLRGYQARLDPETLGLAVLSVVGVLPAGTADASAMEAGFAEVEQVEVAYHVTGEESHLLVVRTHSMAELSEVLQRIRRIEGVARARACVVLSTAFERGLMVERQERPPRPRS
ncbi:MAG TPA: Lrp/AsnC family transcriptional regulator [Actinomycetes bacterium]|jgi:Lrp/AsnC family leucine-responsive transcriptional regulator|nr:Lrp/AsnC family transcriptional regulator [Actinomycetes bacterium]